MEQNNKLIKSYKEIGPYLGLGTQLAATLIIMILLGNWLDKKLGSEPILTMIFFFVGALIGIYNFIKSTLNLNKKRK